MSKKYKAVILVGGTGGHVFPGCNLAKHLIEMNYNVDLVSDKRGYKYLEKYNLMFNKFLALEGRALKPLVLKNQQTPSQHIWSDAIFIYNVQKIKKLNDKKILKLSLLSLLYGSVDLTHFCLAIYDEKNSTTFAKDFMNKAKN